MDGEESAIGRLFRQYRQAGGNDGLACGYGHASVLCGRELALILPQEAIVIERARRRFAVLGDTETKRIEPYTRTQSRRYNKPYHRIAA